MANPIDRNLKEELEFIANTGAIYTVIPRSVAEKLGLKELGRRNLRPRMEAL